MLFSLAVDSSKRIAVKNGIQCLIASSAKNEAVFITGLLFPEEVL